jgi:hypothetical protein
MEFRIRDGPGGFQYLMMPGAGPQAEVEGDRRPELCSREEFAARLGWRLNRASIARLVLYLIVAVGSFVLGSTFSSPLANLPLLVGFLGGLALVAVVSYALAGRLDHARRSTVLIYEWSAGSIAPYEDALNACRAGAESSRVTRQIAGKAGRGRVAIRETSLPDVWVNVEIWEIDAGREKLYFLPDGVLTVVERTFRVVAYDQVTADGEISIEVERGAPPRDARVVGHDEGAHDESDVGADARAAGAPPARLDRNAPFARVAYADVTVRLDGLPPLELQFSNVESGLRFRDLLNHARLEAIAGWSRRRGSGTWRARSRSNRRARRAEDTLQTAQTSANGVLGVRPTASLPEITAAYRALAQQYHPDRHATQPREFRELAERRMKEINAAYEELKQRFGRTSTVD